MIIPCENAPLWVPEDERSCAGPPWNPCLMDTRTAHRPRATIKAHWYIAHGVADSLYLMAEYTGNVRRINWMTSRIVSGILAADDDTTIIASVL
jgi:hypothetical protein